MRVLSALISCALVSLARLVGAPDRLRHPSPWIGFGAMAIYLVQIASQLTSIVQFGYRTRTSRLISWVY